MRKGGNVKKLLVLFAALGLLVAGCGGDDGGDSGSAGSTSPSSSSAVPFDRAFIDVMVPHHRSAIAMARDAKAAGLTQPDLIKIADDVISSQQTEIDQMLEWREEWYDSTELEPEETALSTVGLTASEAGMEMMEMDFSSVPDVDAMFAEMMTAHHEGAIKVAEVARDKAEHDEVKDLAEEIVTAQQREIDTMKPHVGGGH
jgi:uncharacterized protein (DUF305 family)